MRRNFERRLTALQRVRPRPLPPTSAVLAKLGFAADAKAGDVAAELGMTHMELRAELERIARRG